MVGASQQGDGGFDAGEIVLDGSAADLDLDMGVSSLEMPLHLVGEAGEIALRTIPATADIAGNGGGMRTTVEALGQHMPERAVQYLCQRVPYRGLDGPDRHRAFRRRRQAFSCSIMRPPLTFAGSSSPA